jgi:acetolactate synthase small subunit
MLNTQASGVPDEKVKRHTISILVQNKFGAFNRIAGMFAAKGYNIDSLSVGPTEDARGRSDHRADHETAEQADRHREGDRPDV